MVEGARTDCQRGFTLLESMISLTIFVLVMTAVLSSYTPTRKVYVRGERSAEVQQNARLAISEMAREIRMAGFFPENFTVPPANPALTDPVRIATNNALAIYGDADDSGASSVFMLCHDEAASVVRRTRGPVTSTGSFTCTQGDVLAEKVTALQFTYYDDNLDPVPNPPTVPYVLDDEAPGSIPAIDDTTERGLVRKVAVSLTIEAEMPNQATHVYTLSSDVWIRNLQ